LERVGGFDEQPNIGEDSDLMLRIAMAGGQFREARSTQAAFLYRETPGSLWRAYIKNKQAMRNFLYMFRGVEEHLRAKDPEGRLPEAARRALAQRYSNFADLYLEHDPDTYRTLKTWLQGLGVDQPISPNPRMRRLSKLIGFENTVNLRAALRELRGRATRG
jgi:hypothetical protein